MPSQVVEVKDESSIYGGPTKRFFVSMLTRDIDLDDAILDLIDNCVDGAMRSNPSKVGSPNPYDGFEAEISLGKNIFQISDNCGGIPPDYLEGAFSLGRPSVDKDSGLPTIGMYGIGMKRAIFKIAEDATVSSMHKSTKSTVHYSADWLDPQNEKWELPLLKIAYSGKKFGVTIQSKNLKSEISDQFSNEAFINRLSLKIGEHFGYIIQKGFKIKLNNKTIIPTTLPLISNDYSKKSSVQAFDFIAKVNDVHLKITIGFFRPLVREKEIEAEAEGPTTQEHAGISVICNDRIVLLRDRTLKTGWGDGGVPRFHSQFRAIAGLIVLSSNNASSLPISTTKRDLDVGSEVFLKARQACMEGIKTFTDFTNRWKGMEAEATIFFDDAPRKDARREITLARDHGSVIRGMPDAKKYKPSLPVPETKNPRRRITFMKDAEDIQLVSAYLFAEKGQEPAVVGERCFDKVLREANNNG